MKQTLLNVKTNFNEIVDLLKKCLSLPNYKIKNLEIYKFDEYLSRFYHYIFHACFCRISSNLFLKTVRLIK